jgi:hypothetical protein
MITTLLQPLAVLAAWTAIMWIWMYATRIPAMRADPAIDLKAMTGGTGKDLDGVLPARVQWIAHNYNHLHEQPTVFYAVVLALTMLHQTQHINVALAWAYVALRIAHSLFQALVNRTAWRFFLFVAASLCLFALIVHLLMTVF